MLNRDVYARPANRLSLLPGWVYKVGNSSAWAKPELNTVDWIKRNPANLSAKDTERPGNSRAGFGQGIRSDSTFAGIPLGLHNDSWAAMEVYIDGQLVAAFGNAGTGDKSFADYKPYFKLPVSIRLDPQRDYLLAIHIVDYIIAISACFGGETADASVYYGTAKLERALMQITGPA